MLPAAPKCAAGGGAIPRVDDPVSETPGGVFDDNHDLSSASTASAFVLLKPPQTLSCIPSTVSYNLQGLETWRRPGKLILPQTISSTQGGTGPTYTVEEAIRSSEKVLSQISLSEMGKGEATRIAMNLKSMFEVTKGEPLISKARST